jgi:hypothetical protein
MATQSDTIIGPVVTELITIAQQITGIGQCYDKVPETAPTDNSVMFACRHVDVASSTNRRVDLNMDFDIIHAFRRVNLVQDLDKCYKAMPAWVSVLSTPANVRMNGVAQIEDLNGIDIQEIKHGGQPMIGVICHVRIRREVTIP